MAMTERSRNALYEGLSGFIDQEAVGEMLSYFPARDVEEPATKELVRAEAAVLHAELAVLRADVERRFGEMDRRFDEVDRRFGELRDDTGSDVRDLSRRVDQIAAELRAEIRASMRWTIGAMVSLTGVVVAAMAAFA